MKLSIDIHNASDNDEHPPPAQIEQWVGITLKNRRERAELAIRIVSETEITQLNTQYRNKTGTTNVLSLDTLRALREEGAWEALVGELQSQLESAQDARLANCQSIARDAVEHALAFLFGIALL